MKVVVESLVVPAVGIFGIIGKHITQFINREKFQTSEPMCEVVQNNNPNSLLVQIF